jgi:hypothetical protein
MGDYQAGQPANAQSRRRARWRMVAYGAMSLLSLLALTGIAAA